MQARTRYQPESFGRITPLLLLVAVLSSGCSETEWCESSDARVLRDRNVTDLYYKTVADVLTAEAADPVAIFAHRGGWHCEVLDSAPENSISNLEKAIRMGFDGFETDLWPTADGAFVIHHDETLDRTTTGTGKVSDITFEDSRALRLTYPSGEVSEQQIPSFRELLVAGQGRTLFLVELKGGTPERFEDLVTIARETDSLDKVLFWIDWSLEYAEKFEKLEQSGVQEVRTNVLWRARDSQALEDVLTRFDPIMVDLPPRQDELNMARSYRTYLLGRLPEDHLSLVETALAHGTNVLVSKVTTNNYLRRLEKKGVRAFMSRAPEVQLSYLIKKGKHH